MNSNEVNLEKDVFEENLEWTVICKDGFDGDEFDNNEGTILNSQPNSETHNKQMIMPNISSLWTYQYMHHQVRSSPFLALQ
jgi:hypothetical protein